jgi:tetratricopeptide (TPR) repeat protein
LSKKSKSTRKKEKRRRKRRSAGQRQDWIVDLSAVERLIEQGNEYLIHDDDLLRAERTFKKALRLVPLGVPPRDVILYDLGTVYARGQRYEDAYQHFQAAIAVNAERPEYWFNLAMSCLHTLRLGRALRVMEQCVAMSMDDTLRHIAHKELVSMRRMVEHELSIRPKGFTVEQLIEQEDTFQEGCSAMEADRWTEAADLFRRVIAMADVLPQPWGNLGLCLLMMEQYDEGEAALRRALEIEPDYEFAQYNLATLERLRREGGTPGYMTIPPFATKPPPDLTSLE